MKFWNSNNYNAWWVSLACFCFLLRIIAIYDYEILVIVLVSTGLLIHDSAIFFWIISLQPWTVDVILWSPFTSCFRILYLISCKTHGSSCISYIWDPIGFIWSSTGLLFLIWPSRSFYSLEFWIISWRTYILENYMYLYSSQSKTQIREVHTFLNSKMICMSSSQKKWLNIIIWTKQRFSDFKPSFEAHTSVHIMHKNRAC